MKTNTPRREFLKTAGFAILTVQVIPQAISMTRAFADSTPTDDLVVESGESRFLPIPGHSHELVVPMTVIKNPPAEGVKLSTSSAWILFGHWHNVSLTAQDLQNIADGNTVTVTDGAGDHLYTLKLTDQNISSAAAVGSATTA